MWPQATVLISRKISVWDQLTDSPLQDCKANIGWSAAIFQNLRSQVRNGHLFVWCRYHASADFPVPFGPRTRKQRPLVAASTAPLRSNATLYERLLHLRRASFRESLLPK